MRHYDVDVEKISEVFDTKVSSYKYYWMLALLDFVGQDDIPSTISFTDMVAHMVGKAWYPIVTGTFRSSYFDFLSERVHQLIDNTELTFDDLDSKVRQYILTNKEDKTVRGIVNKLTECVPYRFLYPWIGANTNRQAAVKSQNFEKYKCPYAISGKTIVLNPQWIEYLRDHHFILVNSTRHLLTQYLSGIKRDAVKERFCDCNREKNGIACEDIHQKGGKSLSERNNVFNVDISSLDNILKLLMSVIKPGQITINQNFGSSPQIINPENVESGGHYSFHEGSQKVNKINNQSNKHYHGWR